MRKELVKYEAEYKTDVASLIDAKGYRVERTASNYIEVALGKIWRPVIGIDCDDEPIVEQLGFTPTMALVLHLFGRAVHHHCVGRSNLPRIRHWRPIFDQSSDCLRFPRALSKPDIAKIIGKSRSAVDDAVARLRSKQSKHESLFEKRVAYPMFCETGIMLDLMTSANLSFSFMLEDYEYASRCAREARLNDAEANHKQQQWCADATRRLMTVPPPSAVEDARREAVARR